MKISEVKPARWFVGVFLGSYLIFSIIYGLWISSHGIVPDAMTEEVSREVVGILRWFGVDASYAQNPDGPTVHVLRDGQKVLNVFEGCNGLNVMIVFFSFVLAYGRATPLRMSGFLLVGSIAIHLANLARILWLFWLADVNADLFYYFHKYLFTAVIYVIVFALWWTWITQWSTKQHD